MKNSFREELKTTLKVAKKEYFLKLLTSLMIRGILLVIPVLFSSAINDVTYGNYDNAIILLIISIVITAVYRLFEGLNQVTYYNLYSKLFNYYNNLALKKTTENSLFSLSRFSSSSYANIVITDVDIIAGFFTAGVIRIVQIIEYLVIYIYFFSLDPIIFISAIIVSIIMIVTSILSGKKVQTLNENRKQSLDEMSSAVYDFFISIKEIKGYHIFKEVKHLTNESIDEYLDNHKKYNVKFNANNHASLYVFEAFRLLTIIYSIFQVKSGLIEVGTLLLIYNYYQKIIDNFSTILTINVEYRNLKVSLNRFYQLVEYSKDAKEGIKMNNDEVTGNIDFNHVLYGFRDNPTLDKPTFSIKANEIAVLTGRDEAAQIGIFDLLQKLNRQHEGNITLDGIEIEDIDDECYYNIVSSARRQSAFFDISIIKNFKLINNDEEEIKKVCEAIGLDEEINKLSRGYNTVITDNTPISMSTKKLLVIARLLIKKSKILLFDDIINYLDEEHEKKLINLLMDMKKDHTIIIISNTKEIINAADEVFDVHDKIVEKIK